MIEKKPIIFLLLATATILVGTIFTMVLPFWWINDPKVAIPSVKPYTPLQLEGRDLYMREGCNNCHTQSVRALLSDTERYGEYSKAGEFAYDRPFLWGSRRTGPDLARIGGKYPDAWHVKHMKDPQSMVPGSNMPAYAFLDQPLDTSLTERKMKTLDFPYSRGEIEALKGKTELDAMIAYMQKLGNDIPWRQAARAQVVGEQRNPFQDNMAVVPEGGKLYQGRCAKCHGKDLKGLDVGPALLDLDQPDVQLFNTVYSGSPENGMPSFGESLGKERIWKIVTFIKTQHRK
jgi:cytochrome c oxidase cbb3-type subunit II